MVLELSEFIRCCRMKTVYSLAVDFDEAKWEEDINVFRSVCSTFTKKQDLR
jgi:hypothetical protein